MNHLLLLHPTPKIYHIHPNHRPVVFFVGGIMQINEKEYGWWLLESDVVGCGCVVLVSVFVIDCGESSGVSP